MKLIQRIGATYLTLILVFLGGRGLIRMYDTMPSGEASRIIAEAILALVVVGLVAVAVVVVREIREERRDRALGDDIEAHLAPLRTGSRSAERRMTSHLHKIGYLPWKRTSDVTRKVMAAMDARRPPRRSWLPRWLSQPVPEVSPAAVEMPPADEVVEVHHEEPVDGPDLLSAPLDELPPDVHAALGGETSPLGDALAAEMGQVPERAREEDGDQDATAYSEAPDNTTWRLMRDELFARLDRGDFAQDAGAA